MRLTLCFIFPAFVPANLMPLRGSRNISEGNQSTVLSFRFTRTWRTLPARVYKCAYVPTLEQPRGLPIPLSALLTLPRYHVRYVCTFVLAEKRHVYRVYRWNILGRGFVSRINNAGERWTEEKRKRDREERTVSVTSFERNFRKYSVLITIDRSWLRNDDAGWSRDELEVRIKRRRRSNVITKTGTRTIYSLY